MKHVSPGLAVDFVRGLLGTAEQERVVRHRNQCGVCDSQVSFFQKFLDASVQTTVPPELVEQARRLFQHGRSLQGAAGRRRALAQLVFENLGGMRLADVRSVASAERQGLFRWEQYWISVRAEKEPDRASVSIVGQIGNEREPGKPVAGVPVAVLTRNKPVVSTTSNGLGEFAVEFAPGRVVRLELELADDTTVEVPLTRLVR